MGELLVVPVVALVDATQTAEIGGCISRGGGTLVVPRDGGGIITESRQGLFPQVQGVDHDVQVRGHSGLFQVAVGDGASGVVLRDHPALNVQGEGCAPKVGIS